MRRAVHPPSSEAVVQDGPVSSLSPARPDAQGWDSNVPCRSRRASARQPSTLPQLADLGRVLGGTGAQLRNVRVSHPAEADDPRIEDLVRQARALRAPATREPRTGPRLRSRSTRPRSGRTSPAGVPEGATA